MDGKQLLSGGAGEGMTRLALCAVVGIGVIYAAEKLCQGKDFPLWQKYGPWITQNRVQAIAIVAAVLYGVSLALWPEGEQPPKPAPDDGFTPCQ